MGRVAESRALTTSEPANGSQLALDRGARHADAAARGLYERYSNRIFRYCLQRLGSVEEAEDAAQTAFLYAFVGLRRGVEPEFEVAWLYKIAENVCRTRVRSRLRRGRFEATGDLLRLLEAVPSDERARDEKIDALPEVLAGMPASQRRALLLREVQGLSYREIAQELRTSVSAVETLLFRARRSCTRELERLGRPAEKAFSVATVVLSLKSLVSRSLAASGGAKAAIAAAGAAALAGGAIAVTPVVARETEPQPAPARRGSTAGAVGPKPSSAPVTKAGSRGGTPAAAAGKKSRPRAGVTSSPRGAAPETTPAAETSSQPEPASPRPTPTSQTPTPAPAPDRPEPAVAPPALPPLPVATPPAPTLPPAPALPELPPLPQLPPTPTLPSPPDLGVPSLP